MKQSRTECSLHLFVCSRSISSKRNLNELPGTEKEVTTIASLFGNSAHVAKFQEANETSIKKSNLSSYNYLHFATHGIVDETEPELSRIFLNAGARMMVIYFLVRYSTFN